MNFEYELNSSMESHLNSSWMLREPLSNFTIILTMFVSSPSFCNFTEKLSFLQFYTVDTLRKLSKNTCCKRLMCVSALSYLWHFATVVNCWVHLLTFLCSLKYTRKHKFRERLAHTHFELHLLHRWQCSCLLCKY